MNDTVDFFRIRDHVPAFDTAVAEYRAASDRARRCLRCRLDVAYGNRYDEKLDLFWPAEDAGRGASAPIHLFVHGGYWRSFNRSDYSFIAESITALGAIAAIVDYTLMPRARMNTLVDQVRKAACWLQAHASSLGGDPSRLSASGHSAGAHLASYLVSRAPHERQLPACGIRSVILLSGLYDLAPIQGSFLQSELALTRDEVELWSPIRATPSDLVGFHIVVGGSETPPFLEQARHFRALLAREGCRSMCTLLAQEDHMSIARSFGRPRTVCSELALQIISGRSGTRG
jgi:arylformamidase